MVDNRDATQCSFRILGNIIVYLSDVKAYHMEGAPANARLQGLCAGNCWLSTFPTVLTVLYG